MSARSIKGITIEIAGDSSKLVKALDTAQKSASAVERNLKEVNKALKLDPGNVDALRQKQELLNKAILFTTQRLEAEKEAGEQAKKALELGTISEAQYDALNAQIAKSTSELSNLEKQATETSDALNKIDGVPSEAGTSVQDLHDKTELLARGLEVVEDVGQKAGQALEAGFDVAVKSAELAVSAVQKVGEASVATVREVGKISYNLSEEVVNAYGEYEQLAGGVDKLFGRASASVIRNADNAYRTAGMDANTYLQTVTSFSASLIQGLGDDVERAAELSDMALQDMSDNANTFGSAIESIQTVYQSLAKGQFNTLDNLRLGYGGTRSEMIRLINDSGILERQISSLDGITFDQMIEAIHAVQTNLQITGTTAQEAERTIEGSVNMLKASWQNLMIGLGREDADVDALTQNLANSFNLVVNNAKPVLERLADNLPGILPSMVEQVRAGIPDAVAVAGEVLNAVGTALAEGAPEVLDVAIENLPASAQIVGTLLRNLGTALKDNAPLITEAIGTITPELMSVGGDILSIIVQTIIDNAPEACHQIIDAIAPQLDEIFGEGTADSLKQAIDKIIEDAPEIIENVVGPLVDLTGTLIEHLPTIVDNAIPLLEFASEHLPEIVGALIALKGIGDLATIGTGILNIASAVQTLGGGALIGEATGALSTLGGTAMESLTAIGTFASTNAGPLAALVGEVIALKIEWDTFNDLMEEADSLGISRTEAIAGGFQEIRNQIAGVPDALQDTFSSFDNFYENIVGGALSTVDDVVNTFGEGGSHMAEDWAIHCNDIVDSTQTAEQQVQQQAIDIQLALENSLSNSALTAQEKCAEILSAIDQLEALGQREIAITIRETYQREIVTNSINEGGRSTADYYATQGRRRNNAQAYANSVHAQADRERAERYRQQGEATIRAVEETAQTAQRAIANYGGGGGSGGGGGGGGSSRSNEDETSALTASKAEELLTAIDDKFSKLLEKLGIQSQPSEYQNNVNQMIDGLLNAIKTNYSDEAIETAKAEIAKTMSAYGLTGDINAETLEQLRNLVNSQPAQNTEAFTQVQNSVQAIQAVTVDYTQHFLNLESVVGQILALKQSESDTINVYVGNELLDTYIQQSLVQQSLVSGGV